MGISSKEAREVLYWIRLIEVSGFVEYDFHSLKDESRQLIRILTSIVKNSRENL
jgi:four helix bundle protein